ncbi:hypothetical protein ACOMHN_066537 [Nucella lapillus]
MPSKLSVARLTVTHVARAIARLKDRGGSRYTDIRNALSQGSNQPTFFQLKAALTQACKEGVIRQNAQGRWLLNLASLRSRGANKEALPSNSFNRRRRRGKGKGRGRSKGHKKGRRRRRRKGKGKGKGKGRRRRRRGKKGKGKKKGRKRRRRRRKCKGKKCR